MISPWGERQPTSSQGENNCDGYLGVFFSPQDKKSIVFTQIFHAGAEDQDEIILGRTHFSSE